MGTFIPKESVSDPHNLQLWSSINGIIVQAGSTDDLLFNIPAIISFISKYITLEPNDLILTGTPPGMTQVKHGDVVEGGIKGISELKFKIINEV